MLLLTCRQAVAAAAQPSLAAEAPAADGLPPVAGSQSPVAEMDEDEVSIRRGHHAQVHELCKSLAACLCQQLCNPALGARIQNTFISQCSRLSRPSLHFTHLQACWKAASQKLNPILAPGIFDAQAGWNALNGFVEHMQRSKPAADGAGGRLSPVLDSQQPDCLLGAPIMPPFDMSAADLDCRIGIVLLSCLTA